MDDETLRPTTHYSVFHVSQVQKALGSSEASKIHPPQLGANLKWVVELDQVWENGKHHQDRLQGKKYWVSGKICLHLTPLPVECYHEAFTH
ncbi:Hypothetical predicted protein [Olea europaea subsp. europaea]|uniref:Uncharacterized protein n=1 Tax=Olea europaea subsp. europaea TaxID=158383 RepID=A0A8S0TRR9_OLEEU|nr:Hypothetical predicted protein [Olea europaea subsp. europaea]